jgi:hypothetical protein
MSGAKFNTNGATFAPFYNDGNAAFGHGTASSGWFRASLLPFKIKRYSKLEDQNG